MLYPAELQSQSCRRSLPIGAPRPYRYGHVPEEGYFEAVHDACKKLLDDGKPLSAANILAKVGGSKQTVLEVRKEASPS